MAATPGICHSFKREVMVALHNFTITTGTTYKCALLQASSTSTPTTTNYSGGTTNINGEVAGGGGYTSGGNTLANITAILNGTEGCASFSTTTWATSTITASSAFIYDGGSPFRAVAILDFGGSKVSSAGDFTITFPSQVAGSAIIRIT